LQCKDEFRSCSASVPIELRSCEAAAIEVEKVEISLGERGIMILELAEPRFVFGESRLRTVELYREGEHDVRVRYRAGPDGSIRTAETRFRLTNPKREAAIRQCEACHGEWGGWGMTGWEGCNCRMSDAGKLCYDGSDCEGSCLFERYEITRKASGPTCRNGVCTVSLALGVPIGHCSEFRRVFGCQAFIAPGASKEPPRTLPAHAPVRCVD